MLCGLPLYRGEGKEFAIDVDFLTLKERELSAIARKLSEGHSELTNLIKRYHIPNLNILNFFLFGDYLTQRDGYCVTFIRVNPKKSLRRIIITNSVISNVVKVSYHP